MSLVKVSRLIKLALPSGRGYARVHNETQLNTATATARSEADFPTAVSSSRGAQSFPCSIPSHRAGGSSGAHPQAWLNARAGAGQRGTSPAHLGRRVEVTRSGYGPRGKPTFRSYRPAVRRVVEDIPASPPPFVVPALVPTAHTLCVAIATRFTFFSLCVQTFKGGLDMA